MVQASFPIATGTLAERQFTDANWRDLFGQEAGVVGDLDGSAYAVFLPSDSNDAQIGSATQASLATVAGFGHRINTGNTEPVTIPAAVSAARTDIVALKYDPANTGAPGPVRLTRVAGTTTALPTYDDSPPGVEYLPLWAVTRQPGQVLSQATVTRLFPRLSPLLDLPAGATLPTSSPLGTIVLLGGIMYKRELGAGSVPVWTKLGGGTGGTLSLIGDWAAYGSGHYPPGWHLSPDGMVTLRGVARRTAASFALGETTVFQFGNIPSAIVPSSAVAPMGSVGLGNPIHAYPARIVINGGSTSIGVQGMGSGSGTMTEDIGYVNLNGVSWFL